MKKIISLVICFCLLVFSVGTFSVGAKNDPKETEEGVPVENVSKNGEKAPFELDCLSAVLMDAETGTVVFEKSGDEPHPPASVTKVMTLLLTMEAIEAGRLGTDDILTVSEYAASMGGSQIFLEAGEKMSVDELLKSAVVASANDACVTLAEAVGGSETAFIAMMNEKARELGMENSRFENCTGLDDTVTDHVMSARDIAIASRELLKYPLITEYSTIWMDTVRDGTFGLSNTNRLIRFYSGATGLKTGSTSKAKFCISATAERDGLHLIAVIMGAPTRDKRTECAKTLLDWGFANYSVFRADGGCGDTVKVTSGVENTVGTEFEKCTALVGRGQAQKVTAEWECPEKLTAPVKKGDKVGTVRYLLEGKVICEGDIVASGDVEKITYFGLLWRMLGAFCLS